MVSRTLRSRQAGFSLIELLIVVAILVVLMILFSLNLGIQQSRGRDARRKSDLEKIKIVFEEYYNDHGCYPPSDILNNCRGDELQPYLAEIPCDPFTKQPYVYVPLEENECKGYRLLASLEDKKDPIITEAGCDSSCGCGFGDDYNYGISAGVPLSSEACTPIDPPGSSPIPSSPVGGGGTPTPVATASPTPVSSPSPSITPIPGTFACDPTGVCNHYQNPAASGCEISFSDPQCQNSCHRIEYRCDQ